MRLGADVNAPVLNHLAPLDAKILAWLDREALEFECIADLDLDREPELAEGRAAVLLIGHSEYWSKGMFDAVRGAHLSGSWLVNLSGNTMYRQVQVSADYGVRMSNVLTALSDRDETFLTGVRYAEKGYATASPYVVRDATHWSFAGLAVRNGELFGQHCLISNADAGPAPVDYDPGRPTNERFILSGEGAAGFEVDRLTRRHRRDFYLIAEGRARSSAHMVVREPDGARGGVFSASSINFGGSLLVDPVCAGLVRNVLHRAMNTHDNR